MTETEAFSLVIGTYYDAALDFSLWPEAVAATGRFLNGASAWLASYDRVYDRSSFDLTWGYDPEAMRIYREQVVHLNPLILVSQRSQIGDFIGVADWPGGRETLESSEIWEILCAPRGWMDALQLTVEQSATGGAYLGIWRSAAQGFVDDEVRRRMALLQPHLRRAVLIGRLIEQQRTANASLSEVLDGLEAGLFLLDATGRMLHRNAAGRSMLEQGQAVRCSGDMLVLADRGANTALRGALEAAAGAGEELGSRGVAIPIPAPPLDHGSSPPHVAHVLPLGKRRSIGHGTGGVAALFVRRATLDYATALEGVVKLYGLTPGEARVLLGVVEVGGVAQVAEALGMSEPTVKTHLQHVFDKTGARRQLDLVRLVAQMAPPVAAVPSPSDTRR